MKTMRGLGKNRFYSTLMLGAVLVKMPLTLSKFTSGFPRIQETASS